MFIWISLALYVYEFWENVHPYMLIRSYTAIRDLEVKGFALNGPIFGENEANMVSNFVLKDIPVTLPPSDKRFYHNKYTVSKNKWIAGLD